MERSWRKCKRIAAAEKHVNKRGLFLLIPFYEYIFHLVAGFISIHFPYLEYDFNANFERVYNGGRNILTLSLRRADYSHPPQNFIFRTLSPIEDHEQLY